MTRTQLSLAALAGAALLLPLADLQIVTADPGAEFSRLLSGLLRPEFGDLAQIGRAMALTFAFGLLGCLLAAPLGLLMALLWSRRAVRVTAASLRSIHELFWALLLLYVLGLTPLAGLLAIAIPYSGIFAKVYAEILSEQPDQALRVLPPGTSRWSALLCVRLPQAWPQLRSYFFARAECGLRSSAVLGFVGLPTLGYHLQSAIAYGAYGDASAYLIALIALIAGFRWLMPPWSWAPWLLVLPFLLPGSWQFDTTPLLRLLTEELWPAALLRGDLVGIWQWARELTLGAILPGLWQTLLLSVLALVATALITLLIWPLAIRAVTGRFGQASGHGLMLVLRATPDYLLTYLLLILWGPSMLPAIIALMLHNAGIIAFLLARAADRLPRRADAPSGLDDYFWNTLPRLFAPYLAYLFYRWEIILRESAVVGMLGIYTLGFHIDSALSELRLDRLLPLLLATVLLNVFVDGASRRLRAHLAPDLRVRGATPA